MQCLYMRKKEKQEHCLIHRSPTICFVVQILYSYMDTICDTYVLVKYTCAQPFDYCSSTTSYNGFFGII